MKVSDKNKQEEKVKLSKQKKRKLNTEAPISEKDEVKAAEEKAREKMANSS